MSRLNDLIKELCPNGVEYKELYKIIKWSKKFSGVNKEWQKETISTKSDISAQELKSLAVPGGNIKLLSTGFFDGYTTDDLYDQCVDDLEVITIPSGGTANIKYYNGKFINSGNILGTSIDNDKYFLKYIYYCLLNKNELIQSYFRGSSVQHPDMKQIIQIRIPIPPIKVQKEIVQILDKFDDLEADLEAELEARKSQYEFWRGKLFELRNDDYKIYRLEELFDNKNGYTPSKNNNSFWNNGNLPWFRMEDIRENGRILTDSIQHITDLAIKNSGLFPANSIIVSTSATIGEHALIKVPFLCNQRFTCISLKEKYKNEIDMNYIYQYCFLLDDYCKNNVQQGNFNSVNINVFKNFEFKIPSLEKQQIIVDVLNRFEKLTESISEGLPAEIDLRRKQYEYYRNKLLSFEELSVSE